LTHFIYPKSRRFVCQGRSQLRFVMAALGTPFLERVQDPRQISRVVDVLLSASYLGDFSSREALLSAARQLLRSRVSSPQIDVELQRQQIRAVHRPQLPTLRPIRPKIPALRSHWQLPDSQLRGSSGAEHGDGCRCGSCCQQLESLRVKLPNPTAFPSQIASHDSSSPAFMSLSPAYSQHPQPSSSCYNLPPIRQFSVQPKTPALSTLEPQPWAYHSPPI